MGNIFLVGPASVGKTTNAALLAKKLGRTFIDVDLEFCNRIALIPDYVQTNGYAGYCEANSALVKDLLTEYPSGAVIATPSGFLVHENLPDIVAKNLNLIKEHVSVLLLPGHDPKEYVDTVVQRQINRWSDCEVENERKRFLERFEKYKAFGDIKIFSNENPEIIVSKIIFELNNIKNFV